MDDVSNQRNPREGGEDSFLIKSEIEIHPKVEVDGTSEGEHDSTDAVMKLRCLVCYYFIDKEDEEVCSKKHVRGKEMYNIFSVQAKSHKEFEDFNPPLCAICTQLVFKAQDFMVQLDKLEESLEELRQELKNKVLSSIEEQGGNANRSEPLENEVMKSVERIRQDVLLSVQKQSEVRCKKNKRGRPRKNEKMTGKPVTATSDEELKKILLNPTVLLELKENSATKPILRSKVGRVIKRPKRLMMTTPNIPTPLDGDSDDDEEDREATSFVKTDHEFEDDKKEIPDPDWFPIGDGQEEGTHSNDDEEELLDGINEREDSDSEIVTQKSRRSTTKRLKRKHINPLKKDKEIKIKVPVKIMLSTGEKLAGYYVKGENEENDKIEEGSVLPISNNVAGVRILCPQKGCLKAFRHETRMNIHVKRVHKGLSDPFECLTCGIHYASKRLLRDHVKVHGVVPSWLQDPHQPMHVCNFDGCNLQYRSIGNLKIHVRTTHTHEKPFKCEHCPESFVSNMRREKHIQQNHPELTPFKCDYCPKAFFRKYSLRDHVKTHTGERSYLCEICSKSFSQQSYLKYHQTTHEELELEPYKCEQCDKTFASPVNLRIHQRTQHENRYRYHCTVCNHGADHMSHLRLHLLTHSGERPHVCEVCKKSFSRKSQLKIHTRSHTGERPYVCVICNKTFTNSSKLRRHELTHNEVKPHVCQFCCKGFSQLSNLNSHIKSTHRKSDTLNKNCEDENGTPEVVEAEPPTNLELPTPAVFQNQVFGIQSPNFTNIPIQFQVVTENVLEGDGSYAEFIIVNQI